MGESLHDVCSTSSGVFSSFLVTRVQGRLEATKEVRRNFFTVRCVEMWNNLPHDMQAVGVLDEFKKQLDCSQHRWFFLVLFLILLIEL